MLFKVTAIANFYVSQRVKGKEPASTIIPLKTVKISMCRGSAVSDLVITALEKANLAGVIGCTGVEYSSKKFKKYLDVSYNEKVKDGREYNIKAVWSSTPMKNRYTESNLGLTAGQQKQEKHVTFPDEVYYADVEEEEDIASCCTAVEDSKVDSFFDRTIPSAHLEITAKESDTFVTALEWDETAKNSAEVICLFSWVNTYFLIILGSQHKRGWLQ